MGTGRWDGAILFEIKQDNQTTSEVSHMARGIV